MGSRRTTSLAMLGIAVWGLTGWGSSAWAGESKVLQGMVAYQAGEPDPGRILPSLATGTSLESVNFPAGGDRPLLSDNPIPSVPKYFWWYGCTPTSSGMIVGWWDSQGGRENLYKKGDAQVWSGDGTTGTRRMVASQGHIDQTGGHNTSGCTGVADSLSCFLQTDPSSGGTYYTDIAPGLESFVEWDDTSPYDMKDAYEADTAMLEVPFWGGSYSYANFKSETDANRPVLLDLMTAETAASWVGHSVVAYGYQDNMFQVLVPTPTGDVQMTVGGFAVMDTWSPGTAGSEWINWTKTAWVLPVIDPSGVEWWPFIQFPGSSWVSSSGLGPYDWMVSEGITLNVIPEPAALVMLGLGAVVLLGKRRRP